jgi:hypothetical protein
MVGGGGGLLSRLHDPHIGSYGCAHESPHRARGREKLVFRFGG